MRYFISFFAFFLCACSGGTANDYLRMKNILPPTPENFIHCYDYGCKSKALVSLPKPTLQRLKKNFKPTPKTAESERQKIAAAIQIFEQDIGDLVGTKNDKFGTFRLYQDDAEKTKRFQQDCVDESTNTTIYLSLLEQLGFIKFHDVGFPESRQPFFGGSVWWHQTATMTEKETGERYAVDSWFQDNGHPAFIVPLKEWKDGWRPEQP